MFKIVNQKNNIHKQAEIQYVQTKEKFNRMFSKKFIDMFKSATGDLDKSDTHYQRMGAIHWMENNPHEGLRLWDGFSGMAYAKNGKMFSPPETILKHEFTEYSLDLVNSVVNDAIKQTRILDKIIKQL